MQHVTAMFGATVLAPILMWLDPNNAIFISGIGTLIFSAITGGNFPSYLGSSFASIGVVVAANAYVVYLPAAIIFYVAQHLLRRVELRTRKSEGAQHALRRQYRAVLCGRLLEPVAVMVDLRDERRRGARHKKWVSAECAPLRP